MARTVAPTPSSARTSSPTCRARAANPGAAGPPTRSPISRVSRGASRRGNGTGSGPTPSAASRAAWYG